MILPGAKGVFEFAKIRIPAPDPVQDMAANGHVRADRHDLILDALENESLLTSVGDRQHSMEGWRQPPGRRGFPEWQDSSSGVIGARLTEGERIRQQPLR